MGCSSGSVPLFSCFMAFSVQTDIHRTYLGQYQDSSKVG
nr:MAG TPA: hypothetical protein [Caudoviricetes sp.]